MATPQIPEGRCEHCQGPVVDLFAEWTLEYQTQEGKRDILAGKVVFDCYYCQSPLQLTLPLALVRPQRAQNEYVVGKRMKSRCENWLRSQHPGVSLSGIVENAGWVYQGKWAFDGYNWKEGIVHRHGEDAPPTMYGVDA
jgi:hypothetical protein